MVNFIICISLSFFARNWELFQLKSKHTHTHHTIPTQKNDIAWHLCEMFAWQNIVASHRALGDGGVCLHTCLRNTSTISYSCWYVLYFILFDKAHRNWRQHVANFPFNHYWSSYNVLSHRYIGIRRLRPTFIIFGVQKPVHLFVAANCAANYNAIV